MSCDDVEQFGIERVVDWNGKKNKKIKLLRVSSDDVILWSFEWKNLEDKNL